ncbi:Solute carrier family 22 member 6 [Chionoecetes opilio]|uniref:Solute carrier family 22 member 6 n=1 Tax=Chionoecetes opilio TaxID=41210 RepID=A0A8J4Y5L2_CHIOP|nr:Solute carrier family 22 member 6 [Chionoecetes opilio]
MMSRHGSLGAPFITDLVGSMYPSAPFVIFGSAALLAGVGTFLLPETRGHVLLDTVAHLEARHSREGEELAMSWAALDGKHLAWYAETVVIPRSHRLAGLTVTLFALSRSKGHRPLFSSQADGT